MKPEYIIIAAIIVAAIVLLTRKDKADKLRSITTALPGIDHPSDVLTMRLPLGNGNVLDVPYCLDVQRATNGGLPLGGEFWQRYTDTVELSGIGTEAHETVNLGHDESLRSHRDDKLPAGPAAPTCGHGIARGHFLGHGDLPTSLHDKHIVVMECFDKTDGIPVLYPETARELPTDGWAVRNVLRHVAGDRVRLRYTYHRPGGELLCDSGWVELPHSQPLTGADIARALWPASGRVKAVGCEVTWGELELLPLVPAGVEV